MSEFLKRLGRETLVIDGALGTELERRGVDTSKPGWTSRANIEQPAIVTEVHREYIRAGADIITTNSFRTNVRAHKTTGLNAKELTVRSVHLTRRAIDLEGRTDVYVAGSIAPAEDCFSPELTPASDTGLYREHTVMAQWLADAGCDLLLIETMNSFREAYCALLAAKHATPLPVVVSLVPRNPDVLLSSASLAASVDALAKVGADVIMLNCQSLNLLLRMLQPFAALCNGLSVKWGIYPNASERIDGVWQQNAHEDHEFAAFAETAVDHGASIVGSCCGTTPHTTLMIAEVIRTFNYSKTQLNNAETTPGKD